MSRIKVLILADTPGWIVDRITDRMIAGIDADFTKRYYTEISSDDLITEAASHDLVHYQNWDWAKHLARFDEIKTPVLTSIRSFRFPDYIHSLDGKTAYHVVHPGLVKHFPTATYIPDGIFEIPHRKFTVGFAGRPDEYKGFHLIEQACRELGVNFKPALNVPPDEMARYYESIDLYVCASEAEGHSTPVMECLSINKPVITTNVGVPQFLNVHTVERTVEGIKEGIKHFYTQLQVTDYTWANTCAQFSKLYEQIARKEVER